MKLTCFVFKLKRKKQVLALVLIEDLRFLPLVREIQRLSTRSATLHSWKDEISHTRGRNPRPSIGTRVRTYYSIHLPRQSHQTKSQEFPEHFHSFADIMFQFKFRLWLSDLLNRAIGSDIKVLNREGDRLNYHPLPCDRLNWHTLLNQWEDRKFTWNIIKYIIYVWLLQSML